MAENRELALGEAFLPEIRRARFERLTIYEVEESELFILERGSPDSIFLNIAVALLSLAASFTVALLTTTIPSTRIYIVFVVVASIGYVVGAVLCVVWWRSRCSVNNCVKAIRKRLPPEWLDDRLQGGQMNEEAEQEREPDA